MFERTWRKSILYIGALIATIALIASAVHAMTVSPVVIDLQPSGQRMSEIVTIENQYSRPIILEMRTQEALYMDDGLRGTGKDTEDLLVFPPQVIIPAGGTQAVRVQYVGDPDFEKSKHYFMTVAQLPVELPEGQTAVQLLYNFQVVVGVGKPGVKPNLIVESAEISTTGDGQPRVLLVVKNDSSTYGYLSGSTLRIVQKDEAGNEVFKKTLTDEQVIQEIGYGLVGAGQTRRISTPIVLPQTGGSLEASLSPSKN